MGWQGGSRHLNITSEQDAMTGGVRTDFNTYFGVDLYFSSPHTDPAQGVLLSLVQVKC